jgi:hypothetical protein
MVHYEAPKFLAQIPPPICPKCGSHRTEIVGRSDKGDTVILRCNACGERSHIAPPASSTRGQAAADGEVLPSLADRQAHGQ